MWKSSSPLSPRRPFAAPVPALASLVALAALGLLLAPLGGTAVAQEEAPAATPAAAEDLPSSDVFIETLDVNVVNVDVYVTDRDGNPVTGLTEDDFIVYENRRPMKISNFYAVEDNRVVEASGTAALGVGDEVPAADQPPGVEPEEDLLPPDQRLHLVVYIDNFNIHPHTRRRVLQDLRSFLREELRDGDQVMLVSYDRSLKVRRSFTGDARSIVEGLFELDEVSGHAVHHDSERRDAIERINDSTTEQEAMSWARTYAESMRNDLHFSIDALREITTSLAGVTGRKAVVYVSDGIQMIAGEDLFHMVNNKFPHAGSLNQVLSFDASRRFQELAAHANANRVSFYTIDAGGLRVYSSATAEVATADIAGAMQFIDSIRIQNLQSPLRMMAEETGGVAVINKNRVRDALGDIANDFRNFYSLGYTPSHAGDGRYYKIEVELKNPEKGMQVRHRTGYRDKTPAAQMSEGVLAALNFPYYSNPMGLELVFGSARARDDGHYLVPVEVRVPLRHLVLVPRGEGYAARARLFLAAQDERGGMSEVQEAPLPIDIPAEELERARSRYYTYEVTLLMRRGSQKVAIGLRDEIASANSFVSRSVSVGG